MKKRLLSLLLALIMLAAVIPFATLPALAAGYEAIPIKYEWVSDFSEGLAAVQLDGKFSFIDKTGKEVLTLKYDWAYGFSEGLAAVRLDGKWGYIDKTGKEVIAPKYDDAWPFNEGLAAVRLGSKFGFINKAGEEVIPLIYDGIHMTGTRFSEGLAAVNVGGEFTNWTRGGQWGFIDVTGKEVIEPKYASVGMYGFTDGMALFFNGGVVGYMDKDENVMILSPEYDVLGGRNTNRFSEGLAVVMEMSSGKCGYINTAREIVLPAAYDWAGDFSDGMAAVYTGPVNDFGPTSGGKWGFINKTGEVAVQPKYDNVESFSEGYAGVQQDKKWGFIDKSGKEIVPMKYDEIRPFSDGLTAVKLGGKWGFVAVGDASAPTGSLDNFEKVKPYDDRFTDMNWSRDWVAKAFEYGIIAGTSATTYGTTGNMSIQDSLVVASKIHAIYYTGSDAPATAGASYPTSYIAYARDNGIIDNRFEGRYNTPATRAELAYIWGGILPETELKRINTYVPVTDVDESHEHYQAIRLFYEAGIVTGSPDGKYNPDAPINRGECAVMFVRLVSETDRNGYKG